MKLNCTCTKTFLCVYSGRRPDTTKAWNFVTHFREVGPDWTTMPEYFVKAGWFVAGTGKVFHPGLPPNNDPPSWNQPYSNQGQKNPSCPPCPAGATWCGNSWCSLNATQNVGNNDEWIASDGQRLLSLAATQPKPFFVAVRTPTRLRRRADRATYANFPLLRLIALRNRSGCTSPTRLTPIQAASIPCTHQPSR